MPQETLIKPPARPCGSCPYRRDVPSGIWAPSEYRKLAAYDAPTPEQPPGVFMCHQKNGCMCGGWLMTHDRQHLLSLRLHASRIDPSVWEYDPGTPVFGSGQEAADHGIAGIEDPTQAARRKIAGLLRQRERQRYNEMKEEISMKLQKVDKDIQRVLMDEEIVGFAMRFSSGRWGAFDTEAASLTSQAFGSPEGVLTWFQERDAPEVEDGPAGP